MKYQSTLLADARGKLNGVVFTRGRYGSVIRTKVSPVQPDTSYQQLVKQNFGALAASWRGLTGLQIAAWNAAAANWPRTNVFGQQYTQSGMNLYIGLNTNLLTIGTGSTLSDPPEPEELPVIEPDGVAIDDSANTVFFTVRSGGSADVPAGYSLVVRSTGAISAGRRFVKNMFRVITALNTGTDTSVENLQGVYSAKFGLPITDQYIYFDAYLINQTTGQASLPVQQSGIVVA